MPLPPSDTRRHDFSDRRRFPGTHGNRFDILLHLADIIQGLHPLVFGLVLLILSVFAGLAQQSWVVAAWMWLFFLSDWALLEALPRFGWSYGPARPPVLILAFMRLPFALLPLPINLAVQAVGTVLVIYGFWIEPMRLTLTRQTLDSPRLKRGRPLRVLHFGDLHAEIHATGRERRLVEIARESRPDLILFSGDFLNLSYVYDPRAWEVARDVLRQLQAPLGVFAVSGSPAVDPPDVLAALLAEVPHIRWLRDEVVVVERDGQRVAVVGLTCTHKPFLDGPRLQALLPTTPASTFTLLLYHTPDLAPDAAEAGVDLQLSGHTHGGQVRVPLFGALYAASLYGKRFEMGRHRIGGMTVYITRGVGLEGKGAPRVRFLSPPEVTLWEISGVQ